MGRESIGQCGCAHWPDKNWITAELDLAICYIRHSCGEPPAGCELEILWHEHELGQYASVGLTWDGPGEAPWDYISLAEDALLRFDGAVNWWELRPKDDIEKDEGEVAEEEEEEATDEAPPERFELYRLDEMIETTEKDWLTALALFQEGGWDGPRPMEAYARVLSWVKHDEGEACNWRDGYGSARTGIPELPELVRRYIGQFNFHTATGQPGDSRPHF